MNKKTSSSGARVLKLLLVAFSLCLFSNAGFSYGWLTPEAEKARALNIVGPEKEEGNCAKCHSVETDAWKQTKHFSTFKEAHRSDEAKEILLAMGEKSMKRATECRQCHYTSTVKKEKIRASYGVSCESCHGAGKEWLSIHVKKGGDPDGDDLKWGEAKLETTEERASRLGKSKDLGMINSDMIYGIAKNCFGCHTVPNEKVVNVGGHPAGSDDFELLSWSQGEVVHNFASAEGTDKAGQSLAATIEKKRRLFITGKLVDLETTLFNISQAAEKEGKYHLAMIERANKVKGELVTIVKGAGIADLTSVINGLPDITADNAKGLSEQLAKATIAFLGKHDGTALGGLDQFLPTETKGDPFIPAPSAE